MNAASVKLKGVYKYFRSIARGEIAALKDVNLDIEEAEFFVILGPSGCGKSTLLNIIAGLEKPSSGEIWFREDCVCSVNQRLFLNPKQRNVAMVFQSYALYPHMTVFDNISFPLKIARINKNEIEKRVTEVARILNITHLLQAKPRELSGGQRQRVAMARAIIRHPRLFLLDEPLSNLDAKLRVRMRSELKNLQRRIKVTTVYVTHDQVEAMTLGDRIALLHDGEVQQVGSPLNVYNNPANIFVAGFLGTPPMNLLHAKILEKNGKISIMIDNMELTLPDGKMALLKKLKENDFILGIRPEDIEITQDIKNRKMVRGIKLIEHLGNDLLLHIQMVDQELLVKSLEETEIEEGEKVELNINLDKIHFFDKNGSNIKKEI